MLKESEKGAGAPSALLTLPEAQRCIRERITALPDETIPLAQGLNRVVTEAVHSPIDLPLFDNSSMDGYAVRSADVASATPERPAWVRLVGKVAAGSHFAGVLRPGECVRLYTGSPLPAGADSVVMQEDTRTEASDPAQVWILDRVQPGENVRRQGEDLQRGSVLVEVGARLTPGQLGLLAAAGVNEVQVGQRPVVGLLATGSELREAGQPLAPGQIYESNRIALAALLAHSGAQAKIYPLVPDHLDATCEALKTAFDECEVVLTSGGVSVGDYDWVKVAFEQLGGTLEFWRVAIKPGKPLAFGRYGSKHLFGLPGNPASALVTFTLFVRPALGWMQGAQDLSLSVRSAVLAETLTNSGDRAHFLRVVVDEAGQARSAGMQAAHALSSLARANALLEIPPGQTLDAGTIVSLIHWAGF